MSDLISRQDTIDRINEYIEEYSEIDSDGNHSEKWCAMQEAKMTIENMPTIEPERKKGEWIERNPQNSDTCRLIECDQCGFSHIVGFNVPYEHWIENRNFCERCGADMRKGEGEKE